MTAPSEPRWFVLAMASRWPAAIVLAAWAVAVAAIQILKQPLPVALPQQAPFPVRLVGGVTVRNIAILRTVTPPTRRTGKGACCGKATGSGCLRI